MQDPNHPNDTAAAAANAPPSPSPACVSCGEPIDDEMRRSSPAGGLVGHTPACPSAVTFALSIDELAGRGETVAATALVAIAFDALADLRAEGQYLSGWSQIRQRAWRRLAD